jgi:hypothetical protein
LEARCGIDVGRFADKRKIFNSSYQDIAAVMSEQTKPSEVLIIRRAYQLWQEAREPEGKDDEFYNLAEQELRNEDKSCPLRTPDNL